MQQLKYLVHKLAKFCGGVVVVGTTFSKTTTALSKAEPYRKLRKNKLNPRKEILT
jgi:hypothetical protein